MLHIKLIEYEEPKEENGFTGVVRMFRIAQSTSSSIAGLSVAVVLVFVFAAATGCLIFKIRRLTNNQSNHSRAVFSNRAYRADSERKPDDEASINEVDLGVGPSPGGPDPKPPIYDNPSRPLPPVPQTTNTKAGPPCSSGRQTTRSHYDNAGTSWKTLYGIDNSIREHYEGIFPWAKQLHVFVARETRSWFVCSACNCSPADEGKPQQGSHKRIS